MQQKQIKNPTSADTLKFAKKVDLGDLKPDVDNLDIDKLKNVPTNFCNLKNKVDILDVDKLIPVLVDLNKLSDVIKNDVVKKDVYYTKIRNKNDKILDITNLAIDATLNAKTNEVKGEAPSITNLATTTALTLLKICTQASIFSKQK